MVALAASCFTAPALSDDTVKCHVGGEDFYTKRVLCHSLIEESVVMGTGIGNRVAKETAVHICAANLAKKLPGLNRTDYLNECDALASSFPQYRF
jgi:hypothetical protein